MNNKKSINTLIILEKYNQYYRTKIYICKWNFTKAIILI